MAGNDPNEIWLGHVQPVGLVVAPIVLRDFGLVPEDQTRGDSEAVKPHLDDEDDGAGPALRDPWAFFQQILGWRIKDVAGSPGGEPILDELVLRIEESDTEIVPHWAVGDPDGGWQILVRIEAPGAGPEQRGAVAGWEATPHQRLERLCRDKSVPTGLLITDSEIRLIYAPRGETSGWLRFPIRSLGEVGGRPMLGGLKLLLKTHSLQTAPAEHRLQAILKASREAQAEVSIKLAAQVLGALHELLRGLHAADPVRMRGLAANRPEHVYDGLLAVLLRLVFLLYAEDRDLIPSRTDSAARAFYAQGYGVRSLHARLLDDRAHHELTMDERRGAWPRLLALFRLLHGGDSSGEWIRGRGGQLFDPTQFPFLEGRDGPDNPARPADVSDGCILRILDRLLVLGGEKLSYRTLDVEQIGSVYETVMGFTVVTMPGPALAIRAGKNDKTPVFVDMDALVEVKPADRAKYLKEEADRGKLPDRVDRAIKAATSVKEIEQALLPIVDERASPGGVVSPHDTPLLQPTDERRRTGSHYTPRALTGPIVQHALEPAFERLGPNARPEDVLALKVCDPAVGSGAFLVEACRALGDRLVMAWARWPETRPTIPDDEDEPLHARRLVAQRCLYGVDRNPRAVDLAKLSLWLATLARDHEFTFLDHALKCGDSLVGLTLDQIASTHWDSSKQPTFVAKLVADHLKIAEEERANIQSRAEAATISELAPLFRQSESRLDVARAIGNGIVAAFFTSAKRKEKLANLIAFQKLAQNNLGKTDWFKAIEPFLDSLSVGPHPIKPFHWQVEFPEVFSRTNGGFDAIVGNPPFAGKNTITAGNRANYLTWLQTLHAGAHGNADLVAHFFRRAFGLLREDGRFGLIATNTIGQGDTRDTGLATLIDQGGAIGRATRRLKWPGEAAVIVSVVHVAKGDVRSPILDRRQVARISAFLVAGELDRSPKRLVANARKAFVGSYPLGAGFLFDDVASEKRESEAIAKMNELIERNPINAECIFPFIGGEEITTSPSHLHLRYIIDFFDRPLGRRGGMRSWILGSEQERVQYRVKGLVPNDYPDSVAEDWPELLEIVRLRVKPDRDKQKREALRVRWWQYAEKRPGLYRSIENLSRILAISSKATPHHAFAFLENKYVFSQNLNIISYEKFSIFSILQSRVHEVWARFLGTTMKDDFTYAKDDCFETFPFPPNFETSPALETAGQTYHDFRAELMIARDEGMTQTYNRFHNCRDRAEDVVRLRELHAAMDRTVLEAYGWEDLAARAAPCFLDETTEDDHTYQGRMFWTSDFRDEVFARLLALNAERAAAESAAGLSLVGSEIDEEGVEVEEAV